MPRIAIVYATREGHTAKIAHHLAGRLGADGHDAVVIEARHLPSRFSLGQYDAAILAASIHAGKHEREMVAFVRERQAWLERMPTAFLSVSLAETTAEDPDASTETRAKATSEVDRMLDLFFEEASFRPTHAVPVAGALLYTHYGIVKRALMKWIVRKNGGPTDTSRDYEYTDWAALDQFAAMFSKEIRQQAEQAAHV